MQNKHVTTLNLEPFLRNAIGVDTIYQNLLTRVEHANNGNYPPYNIIEMSEDSYRLEMAIAGFTKTEVKITVADSELVIQGDSKREADGDWGNYIHKGISGRTFERKFALAEYVEVTDAEVKDGILTVNLERKIPDALKPKEIKIK